MPPAIQKGVSVGILTTLFTSMGMALLLFFGGTTLESRDTTIMYLNTAKKVDEIIINQNNMDTKVDAMLVYISENRTDIRVMDVELQHCKEDLTKCKRLP